MKDTIWFLNFMPRLFHANYIFQVLVDGCNTVCLFVTGSCYVVPVWLKFLAWVIFLPQPPSGSHDTLLYHTWLIPTSFVFRCWGTIPRSQLFQARTVPLSYTPNISLNKKKSRKYFLTDIVQNSWGMLIMNSRLINGDSGNLGCYNKTPYPGWLRQRSIYPHSSGAGRSKTKVLADLAPNEGFLPGWLCLLTAERSHHFCYFL